MPGQRSRLAAGAMRTFFTWEGQRRRTVTPLQSALYLFFRDVGNDDTLQSSHCVALQSRLVQEEIRYVNKHDICLHCLQQDVNCLLTSLGM